MVEERFGGQLVEGVEGEELQTVDLVEALRGNAVMHPIDDRGRAVVAARREFNGWGYDQLATQGVTFTLGEMSKLAAWVREVLPARSEPPIDGRLAALPA